MPARTSEDVARTRAFWLANKPAETAAPAYVPDPPVFWHVALALVAALLVQSAFAPFLAFRGANVSFVTLLVAWYAVRTGSLTGVLFGLIAGSCEDALAGSTGAAWTFATAMTGLAAGRLTRTWLADTQIVLVLAAAAVTLLRDGAFAIVMQLEGRPLALPLEHVHLAVWRSVLDAAVAFIALRFGLAPGGRPAHRR